MRVPLQGCRVTEMISRAHLLRPLADPVGGSRLGVHKLWRVGLTYPILLSTFSTYLRHFIFKLQNFDIYLILYLFYFFVFILIRSPLRATLTNPTGFGWSVQWWYYAAGAKFGVLTSQNYQDHLNFIDNGLLFLFNPWPPEGGGLSRPRGFSGITSWTLADIDMKLGMTLQTSILRCLMPNKIDSGIFRYTQFCDIPSRDFGAKNKCLKILQKYVCEEKSKAKTTHKMILELFYNMVISDL